MSRINLVDTVVGELCEGMGLGEHTLDADGRPTLRFDEMPVTFRYHAEPIELLWLHARLGETPQGLEAARFLLHAGFECWGLNRMTVGLDETGRMAWGYSCIPVVELTRPHLEEVLRALQEVALPIRQRLLAEQFDIAIPHNGEADYPGPINMLRV